MADRFKVGDRAKVDGEHLATVVSIFRSGAPNVRYQVKTDKPLYEGDDEDVPLECADNELSPAGEA